MHPLRSFRNLTKFECTLWLVSLAAVVLSSLYSGLEGSALTMIASCIGVTALIFVAKGDVLGQLLTVGFSLFYAVISYTFQYYGEMITYLCMSAPIAALSVISWLRNPFESGKQEVRVNHIKRRECMGMWAAALLVTILFYGILAAFRNANLIPSTLSVTTSFLASYLTFRRSSYYALAYAANDLVLIVLWILASIADRQYLSMVVCFAVFFINDLYGFVNWSKMKKRQARGEQGRRTKGF